MEIDLINVTKRYQKVRVINNINYSFKTGKVYFIVGESGCGKSTLIKIIGNLITHYTGKVLYDGKNVKDINKSYLKKHVVTYIDQYSTLINYLSIDQNIDFLLNKNINKKFNKPFSKYSGGEKRRIASYVSSLKDSEVILADEISSSLDRDNAIKIMDYLRMMAKEKILIVVTHDKFLINKNDEVLDLENIVERKSINNKKFKYKRYNDKKNIWSIFKYAFYKLMSKIKYVFSFLTSFMVGLILILLISSLKTGIVNFLNQELLNNFNFSYLLIESNNDFSYGFIDEFKNISDTGVPLIDDIQFDPLKNMLYTYNGDNLIYFELDNTYSMSKSVFDLYDHNYDISINGFNVYINDIIDERDMIIHVPSSFFNDYYYFKGYKINEISSKRIVLKVDGDEIINNYDVISDIYSNYKFKNSGIDSYVYINEMLNKVQILLIIFIVTSLLVTFFLVLTIIKLDINEDENEIKFMKYSGISDEYIFYFYYITNIYRGLLTFIVTCLFYFFVISLSNYVLKKQLEINYDLLSMNLSSIAIIMALIIVIITLSMILCKKRLKDIKN